MKRRLTAAAVVGLSAALALSACSSSSSPSSSSSGGAVTLHLLAADYGTAGTANSTQAYWQTIATAFHKANPDITVDVQTIAWANWDQVATLIQDKQYPDILEGDAPQELAADGLLYPLSDVMSASTISNLIPVFAKQEDTDGVAYGAPFTTSARAMFYNKKLFSAAGIANPPATWADLQADAAKIKALGSGDIGYGLPLGPEEAQAESYLWMLGNGGGYTDSSGKYSLNSAANIQTFQFLTSLVSAGDTQPSPASTDRKTIWSDFAAGQVGMVGGSGALIPIIQQAGKLQTSDWGVAQIPGKTGPLTQTLGVHDDITAFKVPGTDHSAQIKKFLDFVYSDQYQEQFDNEYDLLPATTSASDALKSNPVDAGFLAAIPNSVVYPANANWNTLQAKIQNTIGTAVQGTAPSQVLGSLQSAASSN